MIMNINESNAPQTAEEFEAIKNMLFAIKACTEGKLSDEQKQMIRDMNAKQKDENLNQPEWSETDYLELLVESLYMTGITQGKLRATRLAQEFMRGVR
jgi:hypothetical protein